MVTRRYFFGGAGLAVAAAAVGKAALAALPEVVSHSDAATRAPLQPPNGRPYRPVATLNGWSLPWRMRAGVKEFHLVAEPVKRQIHPDKTIDVWGYNGTSPGPTIQIMQDDRVRIIDDRTSYVLGYRLGRAAIESIGLERGALAWSDDLDVIVLVVIDLVGVII